MTEPDDITTPSGEAPKTLLEQGGVKMMVVGTPSSLEMLAANNQNPALLLNRHFEGDWGEICDEDRKLNEASVIDGNRVMSCYTVGPSSEKVWVITEAMNDEGYRAATTILLPSEY